MNGKDFADIIRLVRRAPLQNMDEAEVVAQLLQRFAAHADAVLNLPPTPPPQPGDAANETDG